MLRRSLAITTLVGLFIAGAAVVGRAQGTTTAPQSSKRTQQPLSSPININTASATELEALPGVGPSMATRIVEYRTKNGNFKKVEDLMHVKGIGEKTFLKLKPLITISPIGLSER